MVRHDSRGIFALWFTGLVLALTLPLASQAEPAPSPSGPAPVAVQPALTPPAPMPPGPTTDGGRGIVPGPANAPGGSAIVHKVTAAMDRMEMTVSTSRILTLEQKVPQAQVNNPDILELTPLSPNQVQVFAKKPGVTQINLWDENNRVYSIDVMVFGDARELEMLLRTEFPTAALHLRPVAQGLLISGYVEHSQQASRIIQLAEEYYPKVITNISIGGAQKVVLHTKVMEISRTKMRNLGIDWSLITSHGQVASSVSGLLATFDRQYGTYPAADHTFGFKVFDGGTEFFAVLDAMAENSLLRVLSEPNLVAISGRPAHFNVGGEIPVLVPQSLGTVAIEWKPWGTQIDFVPIVLGNGQIRLEVRPRVSDIDPSRSVTLDSYTIPGLWVREVETGVEMKAGQTLAIAGLVQERTESNKQGLPWVGDLPYVGTFFRRVHEQRNEIELLILVTPEVIEAMDPQELPPCGPGTGTTSPSDHEFYWKGHIEVPACCGVCGGAGCAACGGQGRGTGCASGAAPDSPEPTAAPPVAPAKQAASRSAMKAAGTPAKGVEKTARVPAMNNYYNRPDRQGTPVKSSTSAESGPLPGFLGPVGYDDVQ